MKVLVINSGSSSIKYKLFLMDTVQVAAEGIVERVGEPRGRVTHVALPGDRRGKRLTLDVVVPEHGRGLEIVLDCLVNPDHGVISDRSEIAAVGHRVVHGGENFHAPTIVTDEVVPKIEAVTPLAPLHNPANLKGIKVARMLFPCTPQVAVFDTAFHQTMPAHAYRYALPEKYYAQNGVRRYGFHGTSHQYVARQAAGLLGKEQERTNLITLHLGSGCSIAAVRNGTCTDTTMGMTPLGGLIMGTRCGDMDPGIIIHLQTALGLSPQALDELFNKHSGLKGICGANDMRDIHERRKKGNLDAQLAFEMFVYSVRKYIGAYAAVLGRLDALVFTAGIGENDPAVRAACCADLDILGIRLDASLNSESRADARPIHAQDSRVTVFVIPTNEELHIAKQTAEAIGCGPLQKFS
jgi:acetate kinase